VKDSFYEEMEHIFHKFPKYHMKILLGGLNAKVGREDIFKPTIGNESLHKISNDNGVGPKWDGATGGWRKLYNEELHNLYSSPSIIRIIKLRRMRWAGHVARMGEKRNVYRLLVRKPEGKRPLGTPRRKWIDNIKMDLLEI
jgi:hypothetical protein